MVVDDADATGRDGFMSPRERMSIADADDVIIVGGGDLKSFDQRRVEAADNNQALG